MTSNNTGTAVPSPENALNEPAVGKWAYSFDEREFKLFLSNSSTELVAGISFKSGDKVWQIANSRDGVADRFSLIDTDGNVQGYWVINQDGSQFQERLICLSHTRLRE